MMRIYGIYKVKKKHEHFILGREQLLYDLLKGNIEHEQNSKEVHYLCESIEQKVVEEIIVSKLSEVFETVKCDPNRYELTHTVKGTIIIDFSPYCLTVKCLGSRMLDLDLFASLSEIDRYFFAVMETNKEWGWLKPVKFERQKLKKPLVF